MDKVYSGLERRITPGDAHYFFGYFDKFSWNSKGEHLIHKVPFASRQPRFGEAAEIGILREGKFEKMTETLAWNWQQGSMLQWFDDDTVIWNDVEEDHFVARLSDGRTFSRPVYTLSPDRKYALSVNFSRLDVERPGYGYPGLFDPSIEYAYPPDDGIFLMDLESGKSTLVISLERVVKEFPEFGIQEGMNWFNHLLFSPDGEKIAFIHRFRQFHPGIRGGRRVYHTRMFTAKKDGSNLQKLPIDYHASHYTWKNAEQLIIYARHYIGGDNYRIFTVGKDSSEILVPFGRLPTNGHCSYSPDGKLLLTDSYPDSRDIRELVLYDPRKDARYSLGRYYAPPILHPTRCDLHPRWSPDGKRISFDSFHEKFRGTYVIDIPEEVLC